MTARTMVCKRWELRCSKQYCLGCVERGSCSQAERRRRNGYRAGEYVKVPKVVCVGVLP